MLLLLLPNPPVLARVVETVFVTGLRPCVGAGTEVIVVTSVVVRG